MNKPSLRGARRIVTLSSLLLIAPSLFAALAPKTATPERTARTLDARVNNRGAFVAATSARQERATAGRNSAKSTLEAINAATTALKVTLPGLETKFSEQTGGAAEVKNKRGALTSASGASNETIVRSFLASRGGVYGLSSSDVNDLVVLGDSKGGKSGLRMLRMEQQIGGRPVFQSETRFTIDRNGRLMKSVGLLVPHARSIAPTINPEKLLTPQQAVAKLGASLDKTIDPASLISGATESGWLQLDESDEYLAGKVYAREVLFPLAPGLLVPGWAVVAFTNAEADWYTVIDAETGDVLWRKNIRNYASTHDARFRVYVQADGRTPADNPAPQSPNTVAPGSGTQFPEIAPTIVSMHAVYDAVASQNGWIDDCPAGVCSTTSTTLSTEQTVGNNVLACLDRTVGGDANACDTNVGGVIDGFGKPTGNPDANSRNRDFLGTAPRDFQTAFLPAPQGGNPDAGQSPVGAGSSGTNAFDQFRRGAITQLFYVTNWYHDELFNLGFDEASANFQNTNFSGFGLGADRVLADAQDGNGFNNANFATPPDGISGRAQMFIFDFPLVERDGDLDSEILIHELTHGTSNRLIGNGAGLNWDVGGSMGEGWGDFYALSMLNNTNADNPNGQYASGAYATYDLAGLTDNYLYGIRRFPYSTNNSVNPLTWGDVDDVTNDMSGGVPESPLGFNFNGGLEVHNAGEIWALSLWEARARVIADPAGANGDVPTGSTTMLQIVTDAMKMTPDDPTFIEGRDALFDADCATNACANEQWLWDAFADRGLGYKAAQPYHVGLGFLATHTGVRESFSVPYLDVDDVSTDVVVNDSAANNNGEIDPGEPILLTVALTNPWRAASKNVASATAVLSTSTPGVTIHDNTSTYGAIAAQGTATGDTFLISLATTVTCGSAINFTLTTTSSLGVTATTFTVRVGNANGTDPVVTYTGDPSPNLSIPDEDARGVLHQINVTDDYVIADVDFRLDSVTHTFVDDLMVLLRAPSGIGTDMVGLIGLAHTDGGSGNNLTNFLVNDDLPFTLAEDMLAASNAQALANGADFIPVFNSPSWADPLVYGVPPDPVGSLARFDGQSTLGTWSTIVADEFAGDSGTLNAWSIRVTPVHFDCVAFAPASLIDNPTKTVSGTFAVGGTVTYTVTITNSGTDPQNDNTGNEFTDTLPATLTLVSAVASSGTVSTAGNTVDWNGALAPLGGSVTITITATINAGTAGATISNQGTASYDSNNDNTNDATAVTDDPGTGTADDPTSFVVGGAAAVVTGTKTVSAGPYAIGDAITYTVTLTNSGTIATLDNAGNEFTDVLPAGLTLTGASASSGTASTAGNTVNWNGGIPASGSVTITINAMINASAGNSTVTNQGTFAYDSDGSGDNDANGVTDDPSTGPAGDGTAIVVAAGVAVDTLTKTVSGSFQPGSTVTYTITITNTGDTASGDNAGDELTDVLPSELTLTGASASSGSAVANLGTNTVTWNGSVAAGSSVTITITAILEPGNEGDTISNQATLLYDADGDGDNETTAVSDDPTTVAAGDPTSFVAAAAAIPGVPTTSELGLLILAAGLAMLAAWKISHS
ncbi:MAG TPA: M36 family metallopeptidase [Thermoanaerobaculia bacterium]|nr:M36 family metallopeptidase [Thermoanaerobaculia bacterium]